MQAALLKEITEEQGCLIAMLDSTLFQQPIRVQWLEPDIPLAYAERCAEAFNTLHPSLLRQLCQYSYDYCIDFCDYVGETPPPIGQLEHILHYIAPMSMEITPFPTAYNADNAEPVLHLELECEWEPEHGLEWLIRGDEILYVGSCEMLPAWREQDYYRGYAGNYVFGNKID
ncbi:DUF6985 domain-containing protein [Paenibacillus sp. SGZ-1009]|uniref:DUF6985 domain-containing protein n=1 Tax=Paenibacillus campi TaxID=3106031 RepID=UPI002AFE0A54|nr:hypothetical protein [Paenibacillus sp. SGZ-1009]